MADNEFYLTIEELAQKTRLGISTIRRLTRMGRIPFFQPAGKGGKLLFPSDAIERAMETNGAAVETTQKPLPGPKPAWMKK